MPNWPELVDAADCIRHQLDISQFAWGEACLTMGRKQAAVAVALLAAKPADHFPEGAGAYFLGMVDRAKAGELHLDRSWFALRPKDASRPSTGPVD